MKHSNISVLEQKFISKVLVRLPIEVMWLTVLDLNSTFKINYRLYLLEDEKRGEYARKFVQYVSRYIAYQSGITDLSKEIAHLRQLFELEL